MNYLVLHYTACNLRKTLDIFHDPQSRACAHLVIDQDGTVYELIPCLEQPARRGAHAGKSKWRTLEGLEVEGLNACSLGIELVNLNGNIFPYSEAQYHTLASLIPVLASRYPALKEPESIVGHEHVAAFRGKIDPGQCFDWQRLFREAYPDTKVLPQRSPTIAPPVLHKLSEKVRLASSTQKSTQEFWTELSSEFEQLSQGVFCAG